MQSHFVQGFMIATLGMAQVQGQEVSHCQSLFFSNLYPGQYTIPPFLQSCLRGQPLHPEEQIFGDPVRAHYEFPWWITQITYPEKGVMELLKTSYKWHEWTASGALPRLEENILTSTLSPADIQKMIGIMEKARELLLARIEQAEADEGFVTDQIAEWEELVYSSATLDVAKHRADRM